jgi:ribosome-associated protein
LTSPDPRETALLCVRYALDKKAYDLLVMDVGQCTSLADFFLICTGRSDTQVQAIAQNIEQNLSTLGRKPRTVEGMRTGHWVLIDYGDVVIHIFWSRCAPSTTSSGCGRVRRSSPCRSRTAARRETYSSPARRAERASSR